MNNPGSHKPAANQSKLKTSLIIELGICLLIVVSLILSNLSPNGTVFWATMPVIYSLHRIRWYFREKKKGFKGPYESHNKNGDTGFH